MRLNSMTISSKLYRNKASVLFCHIPKTGGSSVAAALRRHYLLSNFNIRSESSRRAGLAQYGLAPDDPAGESACQMLRSALAHYAAAQGTKFITGHLWRPVHVDGFKAAGYQLLTVLRDPVDRWFSLYFYQRYKEGSYARIDMDFEQFLASAQGHAAGRVYVQFLGGIRAGHDYDDPEALRQAREGLAQFDAVGLLENLPAFAARVRECCGLALDIGHKRKSPARKGDEQRALMRRYKESADIRKEVAALCAADIDLYEHVRASLADVR